MLRRTHVVAALVVLMMTVGEARATVIYGLLVDPTSTAGAGATSTRSGVGSWHVYALDTSTTDFGLSSYSVTVSNTSAINNRSPVTTIRDSNNDVWAAGFNTLRTGTNVNPITAAQPVGGSTQYLITGFGQTASSFAVKATAVDPGAVVIGPTTSGSWGGPYTDDPRMASWLTALGTSNVPIFIAEGLYSGPQPVITTSTATVYSTVNGNSVTAQTQNQTIPPVPEPASSALVALAALSISRRRRMR